MKKTHISFYDEVYCEYFEVFIGYRKFEEMRDAKNKWQQQSWKDVFDERVKKSFNESYGLYLRKVLKDRKCKRYVNFIIVRPNSKRSMLTTIMHESLHATLKILHESGISFGEDGTGESFTYYQGMIVNKILDKLKFICG